MNFENWLALSGVIIGAIPVTLQLIKLTRKTKKHEVEISELQKITSELQRLSDHKEKEVKLLEKSEADKRRQYLQSIMPRFERTSGGGGNVRKFKHPLKNEGADAIMGRPLNLQQDSCSVRFYYEEGKRIKTGTIITLELTPKHGKSLMDIKPLGFPISFTDGAGNLYEQTIHLENYGRLECSHPTLIKEKE